MKKQMFLAGHRRSGTNFATALLRTNLEVDVVAVDKHRWYDNDPDRRPLIYLYRFPFDTFSSLYDWGSRHWFDKQTTSRMQFLKAGPMVGDRMFPGEGAVSYWKRHVSEWMAYGNSDSLFCIRYEDLVLRGSQVLNDLSQKLQIPRKKEYQPVLEICGPAGLRQPPRNCYSGSRDFSPEEIRFVMDEVGELVKSYWLEWFSMQDHV